MGISTAETQNPNATNHQTDPDVKPNKGGNIRLPAPKNKENNAKAVTSVFFVWFMYKIKGAR
jgi:hypothetical protein